MAELTRKMPVCLLVIFVMLDSCCTGSKVYKKVGDAIVLRPDGVPAHSGPLTSIFWKHGPNIAVEWAGDEIEVYRQFKNRSTLNYVNGELTITELTPNDSGTYTPEINLFSASLTHLAVIFPVPEPSVVTSCDTERTVCTLTCAGNTTGAEPVTYTWMLGNSLEPNSSVERVIRKDSSSAADIKCELQNPVSMKASPSVQNPFLAPSAGSLKVNTGLTVFICLLTAVVVLVLIHKCRTGMWFFQKASMPWEADFWRKQESQHESPGAHASNGSPARQEKAPAEEETPMT
ncbi:lymphocyte function-associated antigen 3-like [Syngnathoides biaculeatus]|uniref:lymphocyte function-associated antigen 3-like n=1 Tax=Syngnathoides biaculeatus TaxID=300417 RepID=UPI002ADE0A67|nr:lymphocyte function-associated antigen 3-like [Syngnathoides biaculeatus]XP_061683248.1 lymphocyte function-associated antigen 3-like [Syngnathoides biaculeatus]